MIARNIENAFARYLESEGDSGTGGMYRFKTNSGGGEAFEIRTGHDDAGELPESGFILVTVLDDDVKQEVPFLNLFYTQVKIELVYPAHNDDEDPDTFASFDACCDELEEALVRDDIADLVTYQGEGVIIAGMTDGVSFLTRINKQLREAQWTLSIACNAALKGV